MTTRTLPKGLAYALAYAWHYSGIRWHTPLQCHLEYAFYEVKWRIGSGICRPRVALL